MRNAVEIYVPALDAIFGFVDLCADKILVKLKTVSGLLIFQCPANAGEARTEPLACLPRAPIKRLS